MNTLRQSLALTAFTGLVNRTDLDGKLVSAVITYKNSLLACHRFDSRPGDADFWRDRLGKIIWPVVGRPAIMLDARRRNIYLDDASWDLARKIGDGNASDGIRIALQREKPFDVKG